MKTSPVDLDQLAREARELDPLPAAAARLVQILARDDWEIEELVRVVELDPALTGRLLGAANSARGGARHPVLGVDQAILRLGSGPLLTLAVGAGARRTLSLAAPAYGLSEGDLWSHSVACALAVEFARPHCRHAIRPAAFVAALLHDVGKLVLARHLDARSREAVGHVCAEEGLSQEEAEWEVLGTSHSEVGAKVALVWGLPEEIARGIEHHHRPLAPEDEASRRTCHQVALADAVASVVGRPCSTEPAGTLSPAIAERLGITLGGFEALCLRVESCVDEVLASF